MTKTLTKTLTKTMTMTMTMTKAMAMAMTMMFRWRVLICGGLGAFLLLAVFESVERSFLLSLAKESARTLSASAIMIYWSISNKAKELFKRMIQSSKVVMFSYVIYLGLPKIKEVGSFRIPGFWKCLVPQHASTWYNFRVSVPKSKYCYSPASKHSKGFVPS